MNDPIPPVVLVGALDTKHEEYGFVGDRLAEHGVGVRIVDAGVLGRPQITADVDRLRVARAGGADLTDLAAAGDRNAAMVAMASGAAELIAGWTAGGEISGVVVLGGSNAGYLMSRLAAELPIGLPKLLISTIVAGDTRPYVQGSDLMMIYPVVDLAGLNNLSRPLLARAADAMAGIVTASPVEVASVTATVGVSMFGVTTACVDGITERMHARGAELHAFHANGTGGRTLERMIAAGTFRAVADITTTELADEQFGGVCSAGPTRLTAAVRTGIPQVVSVGALDMINFGARSTVPEHFADRRLLEHNPVVTLVRTSAEECAELGRVIAQKLADPSAFTEVHVPTRGFSQISTPDGPFYDPEADSALIEELRSGLQVPLRLHDCAVNDPVFAQRVTEALAPAMDTG